MKAKGLDFKHKEVINITDGKRLGFVQDVTADLNTGVITSIIVPGSAKLFNIFSNINDILPDFISEALKEAIPYFGTKIKGYDREDAIIAAVESRTSSPIRIERNSDFESNIKGIYPCGEGAGYAGGITTSAMDGIKVAEAIASIYSR